MSAHPIAIAYEGFLGPTTAGEPIAVASVGYLTAGVVAAIFGVEIDERTVSIVAVCSVEVEL